MKKENKLYSIDDAQSLSTSEVHNLYRKYVNAARVDLLSAFDFGNELVSHSEGIYIYTKNGEKILDFTGGIGVLNHGHNHPRILKARQQFQSEKRMEVHRNYFSQYIAALSSNIATLLPGDLNYCFFPNSGSESVDWSLKTAFKYHDGKRQNILYSDIAFHGKLFGSESVTNSPENFFDYPRIPGTFQFRFNDIESVKEQINSLRDSKGNCTIAGIIVEPINISNLVKCNEKFLQELRIICDNEDIVLIFDEVYSGWCKTGNLFYFMNFENVVPDILCMAKSLGGGKASISGLVTRDKIFKKSFEKPLSANLQTTTFYGFGEETITAIESINILVEENFTEKALTIEKELKKNLEKLKTKYPNIISEYRGSGAVFGLFIKEQSKIFDTLINLIPNELFKDKRFLSKLILASIISELYSHHNILSFTSLGKDLHLIISPPLVATKEDINTLFCALDETLSNGLIKLVVKFAKKKFFN
jgi:putrescine aminotransferase